jgi:5-methylcytosine-specific restriction endonuclease McrA
MSAPLPLREKVRIRHKQQNGRCYWCNEEAFLVGTLSTRQIADRIGITVGAPRWRKDARKRTATAEHLTPKSLGGTDAWPNIVMACRGCNSERGNDPNWTPEREMEDTHND